MKTNEQYAWWVVGMFFGAVMAMGLSGLLFSLGERLDPGGIDLGSTRSTIVSAVGFAVGTVGCLLCRQLAPRLASWMDMADAKKAARAKKV